MDYKETEDIHPKRSVGVLRRALQRPVHPTTQGSSTGVGAGVDVQIGDGTRRLEAVWVGQGWPSDLEALGDVPVPWPRDVVVTARRFSPGALERLADLGANWADETGRAYIEGPDGLLVIRDTPEVRQKAAKTFRWSRSAQQVGELLLTRHLEDVSAREIAELTGWSHAQVSNVLRHFDEQGWTKKSGAARGRYSSRALIEPGALLEAWGAFVGSADRERIRAHRVLREPMAFLRNDLASALSSSVEWACSGWAGLELAAPFATTVPTLQIYVEEAALSDGRIREVMSELTLREVDDGARVEFWAAEPVLLGLVRERRGLPIVSAPRLYADLRGLGGRGEDAAQHAREELLGF